MVSETLRPILDEVEMTVKQSMARALLFVFLSADWFLGCWDSEFLGREGAAIMSWAERPWAVAAPAAGREAMVSALSS